MKPQVMLAVFLALGATHCGGSGDTATTAVPPATSGDGSAPLPPPGNDAGGWTPGNDGGPGAAVDAGSCGSLDAPDDQGADTNCDGADGVVGTDVYVSADAGSDTNVGTPPAPLRTLTAALTLATSRKGHVLVKGGTYQGDTLNVPGMWSIYGGYQDGFNSPPKRELTILSASSVGLLVDVAASATFAHLTIQGGEPSDPARPTAHALRTKVAKLVLDDVVVSAGDGVAMRAGNIGSPGANGVNYPPFACDGVQQPAYVLGENSADGPLSAEGKPQGDLSKKQRPEQGTSGAPGSDGNDASGTLAIVGDLVMGDTGGRGHGDGKAGFGAASGGNWPGYWAPYGIVRGGNGGSGGCPGKGGDGGVTGGSSVAILALAGTVDVRRSQIETGIAGTGGDGGPGGPGGQGGFGGFPEQGNGTFIPPNNEPPPPNGPVGCQPANDPMNANCAAFGGVGGTGGAGGNGGGGAGGWTIGLLTVGTATATIDAATNSSLGPAGDGGKGNGGGRAPNGKRAQTFHVN